MKRKKIKKRAVKRVLLIALFVVLGLTGAYSLGLFDGMLLPPEAREDIDKNGSTGDEQYVIQSIYTVCGHNSIEGKHALPLEVLEETGVLEMGGADEEFNLPEGWYATWQEERIFLTQVKEICPDCSEKSYLGNYNGEIAIFRGIPPKGVFDKNLYIEVKDIHKEQLDKGVPYESTEEMQALLESFSS